MEYPRKSILTVTFTAIFCASNGEPFAFAEGNTVLIGHLIIGLACSCQCTVIIVVSAASCIAPAFRSEVDVVFAARVRDISGSTTCWRLGTGRWSRLNRIATRKCFQNTANWFGHAGGNSASLSLSIGNELEDWAVLNAATVVGALIDGTLQVVLLPTHDEISMTAISGWVTLRPDEWLFITVPLAGEFVGVPDDLVEDGDEVNREIWRAGTRVV